MSKLLNGASIDWVCGSAGGGGDEWMEGGQRDDALFGDRDNDTLFGDGAYLEEAATFEGRDWLDGEDGDDVVSGNGNDDSPSLCNNSTNRTVGLLRKMGGAAQLQGMRSSRPLDGPAHRPA